MDGFEAKELGIARANSSRAAERWRYEATIRVWELIAVGADFTSEGLTATVGQPPHPNQVGAFLNACARRGWIARVGFANAKRKNQHAALITIWRPTSRAVEDVEAEERARRGLSLWD